MQISGDKLSSLLDMQAECSHLLFLGIAHLSCHNFLCVICNPQHSLQ